MRLRSGKHAGKTTEILLLSMPDWAQWMMNHHPDSPVSRDFRRLVAKFDGKPFTKRCDGCHRNATRVSAYRQWARDLMFWCDDCDPYNAGAVRGRLTIVRTFNDALTHADLTCSGAQGDKRDIIRALAAAKGLPVRLGEAQAIAFFS
jgi:hypothetical protein